MALEHREENPPLVDVGGVGETPLREFLAALGAAGNVGMAVIPGVTPGARWSAEELREKVEIEDADVEARLSRIAPTSLDVVFLGCPHYSLEDLARLADELEKLGGSKIPIIVSAPRGAVLEAASSGLLVRLWRLGVRLSGDTCMIVSPMNVKGLRVGTNSYKAYFYLKRKGARVGLAPEEWLLELAARG